MARSLGSALLLLAVLVSGAHTIQDGDKTDPDPGTTLGSGYEVTTVMTPADAEDSEVTTLSSDGGGSNSIVAANDALMVALLETAGDTTDPTLKEGSGTIKKNAAPAPGPPEKEMMDMEESVGNMIMRSISRKNISSSSEGRSMGKGKETEAPQPLWMPRSSAGVFAISNSTKMQLTIPEQSREDTSDEFMEDMQEVDPNLEMEMARRSEDHDEPDYLDNGASDNTMGLSDDSHLPPNHKPYNKDKSSDRNSLGKQYRNNTSPPPRLKTKYEMMMATLPVKDYSITGRDKPLNVVFAFINDKKEQRKKELEVVLVFPDNKTDSGPSTSRGKDQRDTFKKLANKPIAQNVQRSKVHKAFHADEEPLDTGASEVHGVSAPAPPLVAPALAPTTPPAWSRGHAPESQLRTPPGEAAAVPTRPQAEAIPRQDALPVPSGVDFPSDLKRIRKLKRPSPTAYWNNTQTARVGGTSKSQRQGAASSDHGLRDREAMRQRLAVLQNKMVDRLLSIQKGLSQAQTAPEETANDIPREHSTPSRTATTTSPSKRFRRPPLYRGGPAAAPPRGASPSGATHPERPAAGPARGVLPSTVTHPERHAAAPARGVQPSGVTHSERPAAAPARGAPPPEVTHPERHAAAPALGAQPSERHAAAPARGAPSPGMTHPERHAAVPARGTPPPGMTHSERPDAAPARGAPPPEVTHPERHAAAPSRGAKPSWVTHPERPAAASARGALPPGMTHPERHDAAPARVAPPPEQTHPEWHAAAPARGAPPPGVTYPEWRAPDVQLLGTTPGPGAAGAAQGAPITAATPMIVRPATTPSPWLQTGDASSSARGREEANELERAEREQPRRSNRGTGTAFRAPATQGGFLPIIPEAPQIVGPIPQGYLQVLQGEPVSLELPEAGPASPATSYAGPGSPRGFRGAGFPLPRADRNGR